MLMARKNLDQPRELKNSPEQLLESFRLLAGGRLQRNLEKFCHLKRNSSTLIGSLGRLLVKKLILNLDVLKSKDSISFH
jgi:hypothetical protein